MEIFQKFSLWQCKQPSNVDQKWQNMCFFGLQRLQLSIFCDWQVIFMWVSHMEKKNGKITNDFCIAF